ncbi:hypothetical protein MYMAC_006015 [Corallococcus macrosporus DSM 14697]|uniref:Uncharacterized protein n=1 Tax=Corallococcus macrosporus DSM 14697 TaxID=1189310 RepID=A0A250K391_9BACT|nr:hypothetical protein MYMAC_006015 [Corallococcus macrosporus DSM 14697]
MNVACRVPLRIADSARLKLMPAAFAERIDVNAGPGSGDKESTCESR